MIVKTELKFTDQEADRILWLLRKRYKSKAGINTLAKKAVRELVGMEARDMLEAENASQAADAGG